MQSITQILASELGQPVQYVENVIALLDEGSTIPFIARYRKEQHGSMDDTTLRKLEDRLQYLRNLDKRRQEVKSAIEGQGKLTDALTAAIDSAATLAEVEDLYRPYKQKRRTRATVAREKGLEPLAQLLLALCREGASILVVTHDVEFAARYATGCALMFDGLLLSEGEPHDFFAGNRFYTTDANRIAAEHFPMDIICEEVIASCRSSLSAKEPEPPRG